MNPHRLTWGFAYDMPFAAIIAGATLLAAPFSKDMKSIPLKPIIFVWLAWVLWMNVTTIYALEPVDAQWEWSRSMKIHLMAFLTMMLLQSEFRIKLFVWTLVVSIGFYGVKGGIFTIMTAGAYRVWGPEYTFFAGTNPLALTLLMVLPLMLYLFLHTNDRRLKAVLIGSMILSTLAVISTYSRGAFVAAVAVAGYLILKSRRKILFVPFVVAVLVGALAFMPEQYFDRISTIQQYEQDQSAMGRINAWKVAYGVAKDRPLVGGGFQMMSSQLFEKYRPGETAHDVHSIYFEALGEQGFVGITLFLMLMWLALRQGKYLRNRTRHIEELKWAFDLASYLQVSIVAYAVGGAFLGLAYFDLYYHLIALLVLTRIVVDRQLTVPAEDAKAMNRRSPSKSVARHLPGRL
jgi:putative inorganic carbon (HCO3(-)) transporter